MMRLLRIVLELARRDAESQGLTLPRGTTEAEQLEFEKRTGLFLPDEVKEWLRVCNGPLVGPGGIFGIRTPDYGDYRDGHAESIDALLDFFPKWSSRQWLPVASDGCGNHYVSDAKDRRQSPVFFVDAVSLKPVYWVASSYLHFLEFLLLRQLGDPRWPFADKQWVLSKDPDMARLRTQIPLPWETT